MQRRFHRRQKVPLAALVICRQVKDFSERNTIINYILKAAVLFYILRQGHSLSHKSALSARHRDVRAHGKDLPLESPENIHGFAFWTTMRREWVTVPQG